MDSKTARIRALNDELRQNFAGGVAVMTPGIAALGAEAVARIVKTVAVFDDFCHAAIVRMPQSWPAREQRLHDGSPDFLVEEGGWVRDRDPRRSSLLALSRRLGFVGRRAHHRNATAMPDELGQVRVIPVL